MGEEEREQPGLLQARRKMKIYEEPGHQGDLLPRSPDLQPRNPSEMLYELPGCQPAKPSNLSLWRVLVAERPH